MTHQNAQRNQSLNLLYDTVVLKSRSNKKIAAPCGGTGPLKSAWNQDKKQETRMLSQEGLLASSLAALLAAFTASPTSSLAASTAARAARVPRSTASWAS